MTVSMLDVVNVLQPTIITILGAVWAAASPIIIAKINQKFKVEFTQSQWDVIHSAAKMAANRMWALAEPSIATQQFTIRDPALVTATRVAVDTIPDVLRKLGITQEYAETEMTRLILGHLGKLQATAMTAPIPAMVPVKE